MIKNTGLNATLTAVEILNVVWRMNKSLGSLREAPGHPASSG
jgi:hypothetical protein